MTSTQKDRLILWLLGAGILCLFIYSISKILLPFVVAIITAYFLNPSATRIQKLGLSRTVATSLITAFFFVVVGSLVVFLSPVLYEQIVTFLHTVPTYVEYVNDKIVPEFTRALNRIDPHAIDKAKESAGDISSYSLKIMANVASNLWNSGLNIINLLSLLLITPIVTFYMLRDWNILTRKINRYFPPKHAHTIRVIIKDIDKILSGYIRGQTQVSLILGIYYALSLTIAGLEFGLFIGLATGLCLFIPYAGFFLGFLVSILVAFFQFGDAEHMSIIAGIFLVGQVLEGVFITPNLIGNKVGLHPVWIMFGLLAGGAMFGLLGVLVAIPITAVIGVLARFFIGKYLAKIKSGSRLIVNS